MDESSYITAHEDNARIFRDEMSPSDIVNYYSSWSQKYEKDFHVKGLYLGPSYVAEALINVYTDNREQIRVLDVASGTGILGEKLYEVGFRTIDGLDPSAGMLDICRRKAFYSRLICGFMTEEPGDIKTDTYDCIGSSGGFGPGHIPRGALREMIRIVKPGGYVCFVMREEYIEMGQEYNNNKLEETMAALEKSGLWKKVEQRRVDNYFCNKPGVLFLFQVLN